MNAQISKLNESFAAANASFVKPAQSLMTALCENPRTAWPLLNTLSYMEHLGSYRIMATQWGASADYQTLKHVQEEAGHAVLFKRHAERLSGKKTDYGDESLLAPASARMYFARLEAAMVRMFRETGHPSTVYLYMSLIIEFRAVWAYPLLQNALDKADLSISLERLLAEEQGHLYSMARRLEAAGQLRSDTIAALCEYERNGFVRLLKALEHYRPSRLAAA